jgi:hypothetical protein
MSEGDSTKEIQTAPDEGDPINAIQRYIANVGNVFSAVWLRCPIQINNESNRFVLDSRYRFLFYLGIFFYILLFTYEAFK